MYFSYHPATAIHRHQVHSRRDSQLTCVHVLLLPSGHCHTQTPGSLSTRFAAHLCPCTSPTIRPLPYTDTRFTLDEIRSSLVSMYFSYHPATAIHRHQVHSRRDS